MTDAHGGKNANPSGAQNATADGENGSGYVTTDWPPGIVETAGYLAHGRSMIARLGASANCKPPPPDRAIRVVLDIHADDVDELERQLDEVVRGIRSRRSLGGTWGSPTSGGHVEVLYRDVTHEQFYEELTAWRDVRMAAQEARDDLR